MKAFVISAVASVALAACGGGGGGSTDQAAVPTCTYPTVSDPTPLQIAGNTGRQDVTDTTKKLSIIITGNTNTVNLGHCVVVESLAISSNTNTVHTESTSRIEAVRFETNSNTNTVWVPTASNTIVTNLGNTNSVKRY